MATKEKTSEKAKNQKVDSESPSESTERMDFNSQSTEAAEEEEISLQDTLKRMIKKGLAETLSEDSLKSLVGDITSSFSTSSFSSSSKDMLGGLFQNVRGIREEIARLAREEFKKYLSKLDSDVIIQKIIENYDIEMKTHVSFKRKAKGNDSKRDHEQSQKEDGE